MMKTRTDYKFKWAIGAALFLGIFIFPLVLQAQETEENLPPDISACSGNFSFDLYLNGQLYNGGVYSVDTIVDFSLVSEEDGIATQSWDFYYFQNGDVRGSKTGIHLPFEWKRNYRAMTDSSLNISLMLTNKSTGQCSVLTVPTVINH